MPISLCIRRRGRGRHHRFFESEMNARAQSRHRLEGDLRRAITNGEFEL